MTKRKEKYERVANSKAASSAAGIALQGLLNGTMDVNTAKAIFKGVDTYINILEYELQRADVLSDPIKNEIFRNIEKAFDDGPAIKPIGYR